MKSAKPSRLAAWILKHFGPELNREALAGDLNEAFHQGRSKAWYWRQVLAAVQWRRVLFNFLLSALAGWWLTSPIAGDTPFLLNRQMDMVLITAVLFVSSCAPAMMRRRLRILLALLIAAIFALLWRYERDLAAHDSMFFGVLGFGFAFHSERPARGPYPVTIRELLFGDPIAERHRLVEKLHLAMLQQTDPEVRQAYAESIAVLKRNASPTFKATQ